MELHAIGRNAMAALSWSRIALAALAIAGVLAAVLVVFGGYRQSRNSALLSTPVQTQEPPASPTSSMRHLPSEVQLALVSLCNGCTFADSDAAWSATDVVDDRLPRRRLTRTEKLDGSWHIEYEHGGIATFQRTVVLSATPRPTLLQGSSCVPGPRQECRW